MTIQNMIDKLKKLSKLIRYYILFSTTEAGSGHPTSSLSATDLMAVLFFGGFFRVNLQDPKFVNNDRFILSKGHAVPALYAVYAAAGILTETDLKKLRKFDSPLEGHPVPRFPYSEVATGSLGQGLSVGVGMAINAKYLDKLPYRTYVLLGDSEMAEGSVWEAIELASYYKLDNLIGIIDVNRLGQRGETMLGHKVNEYAKRISAFGWQTIVIDGHNLKEIEKTFKKANQIKNKPIMIIAKTIKGKGVSFLENKNGWHGKALSKEEFNKAVQELGEIDKKIKGEIQEPEKGQKSTPTPMGRGSDRSVGEFKIIEYPINTPVATRKAFGNAITRLAEKYPEIVVLDGEVGNSTYAEIFEKKFPKRFFQMFIAEQNMVGTALGLDKRGKIPFVPTFGAFLIRAFDQIRMSQYSEANLKFIGSHAGVSIGEDGPSQMALEDIAMFRTILNSVVLYPSDAISTEKLVEEMIKFKGIAYLRTTRSATPIIYKPNENFPIGGSKVLKKSEKDAVTVVAAGITLFEALKAYEILKKEGINIRIIDLYSIKPIDAATLQQAAKETKAIITVEDHFAEGGMGEAVRSIGININSLAVRKMPRSGRPEELLDFEEISAKAIIKKIREIMKV
ncbi:MAG: transketolase [Patescibacteria group bacterium]|nr:transketolase [Patescibacteria group bacterium]MDD5534657.1 transketolase [Patescibacteria group bacterium]